MKFLQQLFNFYINSSIHVALAVYGLVRITELYFELPYNEPFDYFVFYGTITGYNFVKYAEVAKLYHRSLTNNLKIIQIFSLVCFILTVYYAFQINLKTLLLFVPFGLLTLLYAVPVLHKLSKNFRSVPTLKILIIATVWAGITVLLPVFDGKYFTITQDDILKVALLFAQRLLFVIVLTLPFDIRDFRFDKKELQTIPQLIGVARTKKLGFILLGFTLLLEFFITPNLNFKTVFLIVFMLLLVLLQRASIQQKKYYSSFWVEAIPIFWWVLLLIFANYSI